ncbi:hypothetical protein J6O48_03085 [bacterium]|nr:hypothetical protein [bacterium]
MGILLIIILGCIFIAYIVSCYFFIKEINAEENRLISIEIEISALQEKVDNILKEIDESINNDFTKDNITEVN